MRFWAYFRLHFLSFLQQGGSSVFCNPSKQNHDFQGSRASIFQCFFPIFSAFHSGPHFSSFFGDFRVAKAPVLELLGLIFRHQKKESKKGLRLFTAGRDYWGGGIHTELSSHAGKNAIFEGSPKNTKKRHKITKRENWAPMQVKPRFLCENHVRGSPLGDAFWYNSRVFLCFFLLFFRPCAQNGIL